MGKGETWILYNCNYTNVKPFHLMVNREGFNAITALNQRKLIGDSKSFSMEMTKEPALQGSEKNVKTPCNIR